jgi:hypothetical protein
LPGFNFFQGPGRFGIVTTLAVGLLAGRGMELVLAGRSKLAVIFSAALVPAAFFSSYLLASGAQFAAETAGQPSALRLGGVSVGEGVTAGLCVAGLILAVAGGLLSLSERGHDESPGRRGRWASPGAALLFGCIAVATLVDLWIVGRLVTYSPMVADPPINHLAESPLRHILKQYAGVPRLLAPGPNFPTVLGASAVPPYLTFGPREYVDPKLRMPEVNLAEKIAWLQRAGVTHVLSFEPLPRDEWPVQPVWTGYDPVLNPAWARFREPLYLYRLDGSRGRASWIDAGPGSTARVVSYSASRVEIEVESVSGGLLALLDLMSPEWQVTIDGAPAEPLRVEGTFRGARVAAGTHHVAWTYRPRSVYWGAAVSVAAFLILAAVAHVRFWHPHRLRLSEKIRTKGNEGNKEIENGQN